jgi:hypothetical protein
MSYTALSLSQTPPLAVPLRYFLSAPLYLIAAGLILVSNGPELFASRWSPAMLALTHLITLGFLGSCMLGAIQQLLPVLLGVPVAGAGPVSLLLYLLWSLGTAALVLGMGLGWAAGLQGGAMLLGLAAAGIALVGGRALWRTTSRHATVPAMALALLALLVAFSIALYLLWRFGWQLPLAHPLTRLHIGWGAVGWVGLLIIGVAYQVVPMFQITPEYPRWLRRALVPALAALLLLWSLLPWPVAEPLLSGLIAAALVGFALQTLRLQRRRRRRLADVTLDFWRLAMAALLLAVLAWLANRLYPLVALELAAGVLFLAGFALSAVNGMLYKIVPFLVWLHLNNRLQQAARWQGSVPNMKQVIPERMARWQLRLQLAALLLLLAGVLSGGAVPPVVIGITWLASSAVLLWNLLQALRLYRRVAAEQGG